MRNEFNEIWKPIKNYENWFELSNYGRVKQLANVRYLKNGQKREIPEKLVKPFYNNTGYLCVRLYKYESGKNITSIYCIHRLVAIHFIENPNNLNVVNHIDGIKTNNNISNLEWCTSSYNNIHAKKNGLRLDNTDGFQKINNEHKVELICYDKNKNILHKSDCSRSMAKWIIANGYVTRNSTLECVARAIRRFSNEKRSYYGLWFERQNESISVFEKKSNITIFKDKKKLITLSTSQECANWLLKNHYIEYSQERTIARGIRKAIKENKPYHKFIFIKE